MNTEKTNNGTQTAKEQFMARVNILLQNLDLETEIERLYRSGAIDPARAPLDMSIPRAVVATALLNCADRIAGDRLRREVSNLRKF